MKWMTQNRVRLALALCLTGGFGLILAAHAADAAPGTVEEVVAKALAKDAVCTRCHDETETKPILAIYQTRHGVKADARTPSCQSCHGESSRHLAGGKGEGKDGTGSRPSPDVVFKTDTTVNRASEPQVQAGACIACHTSGKRVHWAGSPHESNGVPCAACHAVHVRSDPVLAKVTQPEVCFACHKPERAQTHRISTHPLAAGKMACSDCHNPHGTTGPKLLAKDSVNATCTTCHAEKRGPFLWEHAPVTDDCTNCHTPHGSVNTPLLKARAPMLCQQCHSGDHGAQLNSGANLANGNLTTVNGTNPLANAAARAQLGGRACLNCHVLVHGSNHPAGAKFQR
jgi:DmsE family decaheme c-type cytochrome